jgi:hypothetical protein
MKDSLKVFGVVILASALILVLVFFYIKVRTGTSQIIEDSECKSSIEQHAFLLRTTKETIVPEIYCPTRYYTLSGSDETQTKSELAEAMKTCWGTWGRGKLNLFKEEGYYCHMCSVINFKENDKSIPGFSKYLIDTPVKPGSDLSYMDYLAGYASEKANPEFAEQYRNLGDIGTIDTSKTYAVMFLYAKGNKFIKALLEGFGSLTGSTTTAAGGAVIGGVSGAVAGALIAKAAAVIGLGVSTGGAAIVGIAVVGVAGFIWGATKADNLEWFALTTLQEYDAETLKQIGCEATVAAQKKPE